MVGASAITVINNARTMDDAGIIVLLATLLVTVIVIAILEWRRRRRGKSTITGLGHGLKAGDWITLPNPDDTATCTGGDRFQVIEVTATTFTVRRRP